MSNPPANNGGQANGYENNGAQWDPYAAYAQGGYPGGQPQQGYSQQPYGQQGYYGPQQGGQQPPYMNGQPANPYQQNPYQQNPYQQAPYQQNPYQQNPYQQVPYQQNPYAQQAPQPYPPQNGYMPQGQAPLQSEPKKRTALPRQVLAVALCVVLPLLFLGGLLLPGLGVMKYVFIIAAVLTVAVMWVGHFFPRNTRITFTMVYAVLVAVALVSALSSAPGDRQTQAASQQQSQPAAQQQTSQSAAAADTSADYSAMDPLAEEGIGWEDPTQPTPGPTAALVTSMTSEMQERLTSFLYFWSVNSMDDMLALCAPSWVRQQDSAQIALFGLLKNRTPVDYQITNTSGTESDISRSCTVVATIDRHMTGQTPVKNQFKITMLREDDAWFVDPRTLESNVVETPTPVSAEITQPPQPASDADPSTPLYYNPDGGTRYHLDAYCKSANEKFLPFKGTLTYGQLNEEAYKNLVPCNVCGAPLRPGT